MSFYRLHNALDWCGNGSGETTVVVGWNQVAGLWGRPPSGHWPPEPTSRIPSIDFWCRFNTRLKFPTLENEAHHSLSSMQQPSPSLLQASVDEWMTAEYMTNTDLVQKKMEKGNHGKPGKSRNNNKLTEVLHNTDMAWDDYGEETQRGVTQCASTGRTSCMK